MQEEISELRREIEVLKEWKRQKEQRQIDFPLDEESITNLNKYFMRIVDEYIYFGGAGDNSFQVYVGAQDDKRFGVNPGLIRYTVNATSNVVEIVEKIPIHRFANDATVVLFTTDTMPGGLSGQGLTTYHVISAAADGYSFQLSTTQGGSAVDITSVGAGRQFLQRI